MHASANGVDPDVMVAAAAMLLAGRAVIATGPAAEAAALGLSRALAGGNQINFSVPSSIFSVDDMLGLRSAGAVNSHDVTVQLSDLLRSDSPRPFLATLTNIDRAPFEVTFADLAMRYVPKLATAQESEYADFGGLISTMMSGPSTFLIPRSLRCHTGVIYSTWVDVEPDLDQAPRTAVQLPMTGIEESAVATDVRAGLADLGISPREAKRELQVFAAAFGDRADAALWWSLVRLPGLLFPQDVESRLERSGQNKAMVGSPRIQRIIQAVSAVTQSE
jgi:hypothetical protein